MNSFRPLVYLPDGANATSVFCRDSGLVQGLFSPANEPGKGGLFETEGQRQAKARLASSPLQQPSGWVVYTKLFWRATSSAGVPWRARSNTAASPSDAQPTDELQAKYTWT
jgi:hypothetical protein